MKTPPWSQPIEAKLRPYQFAVTASLVVILVMTVYMLLSPDATKRTAWAVYMWLP